VEALVDFMVRSVVDHPEDINLKVTEGDASVLFELSVHEDDHAYLLDGDDQLIAAMRQILGASGGNRRGVLELVGESDQAQEE
jgi:predicted RNA-binding protein YlqC (UPF0109 family)